MKRRIFALVAALWLLVPVAAAADGRDDGPRRRFARACDLFDRGHWTDAQLILSDLRDTWRPADAVPAEEIEYRLAVCAVETDAPDAPERLQGFITRFPASPHSNDIELALASWYCIRERWEEAEALLAWVNYDALDAAGRERYDMRRGYIAFVNKDYPTARRCFDLIDPKGACGDHATYYRAYMDYTDGRYDAAETGFRQLLKSDSYGDLVPFYLLQIDYCRGRYDHVIERATELLPKAAASQQADLYRLMAGAHFHREEFSQVFADLENYRAAGGKEDRETGYMKGYALYRLARYGDAAPLLRGVCGADDELTQNASYHLADCYLRTGDKRSAMQAFAMAAGNEADPALAEEALYNYGKLQYELGGGRFNEAIHLLTRYLNDYPNSSRTVEVRRLLAAAYYNSRDYDAAYDAMHALPERDAEMNAALQKIAYFRGLDAWEQNDPVKARSSLEESASMRVSPRYGSLANFWLGEIDYAQGRYGAARERFDDYLRRAPRTEREYALAWFNRGYCGFSQGRYDEAGADFDRFLKLYTARDDYRTDALNRSADCYYVQRRFQDALATFDAAMASGGRGTHYARYRKALTLGALERTDEKIALLKAIVRDDRGDYVPDALYEQGRACLTAERYREGAQALESFVARYPRSPRMAQACLDLGLVYLNLGNDDKALDCYGRVIAAAPGTTEARSAQKAARELFVARGDASGYFDFARRAGVGQDISTLQRDSLTFAAARSLYLAEPSETAARSLRSYVKSYADGAYVTDALYYLSLCPQPNGREQVRVLQQLVDRGESPYRIEALGSLAEAAERERMYDRAAAAWLQLTTEAPTAGQRQQASEGYVRTTVAQGDERLLRDDLAAAVAAMPNYTERALREARFARAGALERAGRQAEALELYRTLCSEVRSAEGAEAKYRVIAALHAAGEDDAAEKAVFEFSESRSPHNDWLARAFILLGDIYQGRGDSFQARATWQSVVDGYTPRNDGIVDEARERIQQLKD